MSPAHYKVIFKGSKKEQEKDLSLTFKSIDSEKLLTIPSPIIINLKKLSEKSPNIISYQNIEEVVKIGTGTSLSDFNYYLVILYTYKKDNNKVGFLIGNVKNQGDLLIGIWPFNEQLSEDSLRNFIKNFENLIKNPHDYNDISVISG